MDNLLAALDKATTDSKQAENSALILNYFLQLENTRKMLDNRDSSMLFFEIFEKCCQV